MRFMHRYYTINALDALREVPHAAFMTETVKLYFSPLACSLASRIALYECGAAAEFVQIDPDKKLIPGGQDYLRIHPLGLVPALQLPNGELICENPAVLQYIAEHLSGGRLKPTSPGQRSRLQQYLSFVGSELHKAVFTPLLDRTASESIKNYALEKVDRRFSWLSDQLADRRYLLDDFSVADAYLLAVLNWCRVTPVELDAWPVLRAYEARLRERPAVVRAFTEEFELYREQQARRDAPPRSKPPSVQSVIDRFNRAFLSHAPELLPEIIDPECVLENSAPAPDGARAVGQAACLSVWQALAADRSTTFELEHVETYGDCALIRWRCSWGSNADESMRGLNRIRVARGKIVEAQGYVKAQR